MGSKTTLADIAESMGLSVATVHRALTGQGRINEDTKQRILQRAAEMQYQPNVIASHLSSKRKSKIAFLCPDNFFYQNIIEGAKAAYNEYRIFGLSIDFLLADNYSPQIQSEQLTEIINQHSYDAIALSPTHTLLLDPLVEAATKQGIPVVTFNNDLPNSSRSCFVGENAYISGQLAAQLYCSILPKGSSVALMRSLVSAEGLTQRIHGFLDYIQRQSDIQVAGVYDFYDNIENAYEISKQLLLSTKIPAIFSNSMMGTIGIARAISELQSNTFVLGYDINEEIEEYIRRQVLFGSFFQFPYRQGYYTIKVLYKLLKENALTLDTNVLYLPTQLILKTNLSQIHDDKIMQTMEVQRY